MILLFYFDLFLNLRFYYLTFPLIQTSLLIHEDQCFIQIQRTYQLQILVMDFILYVCYQNFSPKRVIGIPAVTTCILRLRHS